MGKTNKVAFLGAMLGLALILSYVESLIPFYFGIPGMKLGLPNLCVLIILERFDGKSAFLVNILRIFLVSLLFGNYFSMIFGLTGGIFSFFVMILMRYVFHLNLITTSIAGGIFHNIGQILAACIVVSNYHLYLYLPVLFIAGIITGGLIGIVAEEILRHLPRR